MIKDTSQTVNNANRRWSLGLSCDGLGDWPHLNKRDLALANVTAGVSDGDLPVVLDPALATENVVDAGRDLVPLIVVSKSEKKENLKLLI